MFQLLITLVVAALVFAAATDYPKVKVEVYYEALCPGKTWRFVSLLSSLSAQLNFFLSYNLYVGCQQFITGALFNTLAHDDIKAIVDLKMVPYVSSEFYIIYCKIYYPHCER